MPLRSCRFPPALTVVVGALALLLAVCEPAAADSVSVERPGSVRVDLGTGRPARTVHVTLRARGDEFLASLRPRAGASRVIDLLVPDQQPERSASQQGLPVLELRDGVAWRAVTQLRTPRGVHDEGTALRYLRIARVSVEARPDGAPIQVRVRRGDAPTRAALRVSGGEPFSIDDVARIRRSLGALQGWHDVPADPEAIRGAGGERSQATVWVPAGLALSMLLLAGWWIWKGRVASRRPPGTV